MEDDFQINVHGNHYIPQYSLNGTDWVELQVSEQTPAINTGEKIYFKGTLEAGNCNEAYSFRTEQRFNLSGNVMSMIFDDKAQGKTDLTGYDECFVYMFDGCTGLISVSKNFLPATTLAYYCYQSMFAACTSLVQAPALPATTLAESCYDVMFAGCTSLVNAPELPATNLTVGCYNSMFIYCTSLVNAPELPATILTNGCYSNMFNNCTSLETAPELPATTLADSCYYGMFYGCTSLNYIKMLATDISATDCLGSWVDGVSETGTFVKSKDATWDESGVVPEGWTVETV